MKKTLKDTLHLLKYNFKTLFYFELMYRALGVLIVFPLAQFLFYTSIKLSGYVYITNALLFEYLTKPFTILSLMLLLTILSFYMMIEMIILSMIFDSGSKEETLGMKDLLIKGSKRVVVVLRRYHVRILLPAFFFFILIELFHVVGIAQTINIPDELLEIIHTNAWFIVGMVFLIILIFVLFIQTIFSVNLYAIDKMTPKEAKVASKYMLKGKRLEMSFEFIMMNVILNVILYLFYAVIVFLIGAIVSLTRGTPYVLSVILSVFYSVYVVVGFLATITLIPINFALITSWYEEGRQKDHLLKSIPVRQIKMKPFKHEKTLKQGVILAGIILFIVNLVAVISLVNAQRTPIEIFNVAEIVAHRGQSADAPENTLSAIELAIINGVDAVEIDVRRTVDGVPVLMHDATTRRTTNDTVSRNINQLTLAQVKELDAGSWFSEDFRGEQVPTLEEALELIQRRTRLFLEFKEQNEALELEVIALLDVHDMMDKTVILSFSNLQLERIKRLNPNVETLLLVHTFFGRYEDLVNAPYADHYGLSLTFFRGNESFIDVAHQKGKKVYIWTVNQESDLKEVVDSDVDGIITDRPVLAKEIAYAKNTPEFVIELLKQFFKKYEQGLN